MKNSTLKLYSSALLLIAAVSIQAQPWKTSGNSISSGDFLGTTNNASLVFKTNNVQQMVILSSGNVQLTSFDNGTTGLVTYNSSGTLVPIAFNGNSSTVLSGDGTFVSASAFSPWILSGKNLYYTAGNIGIGVSNPTYPLQVNGNTSINGDIFVNNANAQTITIGSTTFPSVAITIDGKAGTITSAAGNVGFGSNNINTSGNATVGGLQANGSVKLPGIATTDSAPDLMRVDKSGNVSALSASSLHSVLYSNVNQYVDPCGIPDPAAWNATSPLSGNGFLYTNSQCTWVGIDVPSLTGYPTEPLDVGGLALFRSSVNINGLLAVGQTNPYGPSALGFSSALMVSHTSENTTGVVAQFLRNSEGSFIMSETPATGDFNPLVLAKDNGLIFTDGGGGISTSGFVIGPWNPIPGGAGGLRIDKHGNIGIGTSSPTYALDVNGIIRANEVKVCLFGTCDFVFEDNYNLMSLDTLSTYLKSNHHLPGIASAKQMEEEGNVSLGKLDSQLLQKVEELTLYTIQLQKKTEEQDAKIKELETKLNSK